MHVLILGGTRNLGPSLVQTLLERGDTVTILHRGLTPHTFSPKVQILHADRTDPRALRSALGTRTWDLAVDMMLMTGEEATSIVDILTGRIARYIALSTGQVYLVRQGLARPFPERDYPGPLTPQPASPDLPDWRYGIDKRAAEDALFAAHARTGFPATTLRLPMINSERDHYQRLRNYIARIGDGQPLLLPSGPHLDLRHVYGGDVIRAILHAGTHPAAPGTAWNISQPDSISLTAFLTLLASLLDRPLHTAWLPRETITAAGLLRFASPFSDLWMSALDSTRSIAELGMTYTPLDQYLAHLVAHARRTPITPSGYAQRPQELALLRQFATVATP